MPAAGSTTGPYWWRRRRGYVLGPFAIGLALCALSLWAATVYEHNQADFRAHAVRARAVIDEIYTSAPSQGYTAPTFDEYALVHFVELGERTQARVLLESNCTGTCTQKLRIGDAVTVDYDPANPGYAQLPSLLHGPSPTSLYVLSVSGLLGLLFIGAAFINMRTA